MEHCWRWCWQLAEAHLVEPTNRQQDVLYDRQDGSDQITGGNIQFSDGSSVAVETLPNTDSAYTLTFANKTITSLTLNITAVSASTQNVGLYQIAFCVVK